MIKVEGGSAAVVRLEDGEKIPDVVIGLGLKSAGLIAGIGMLRDLVLGYWDGEKYVEERVGVPVELLALQGNIGDQDGKPVVHAHVVAGRRDGQAVGGHLLAATVHNTVELIVLPLPGVRMSRRRDPSGLLGLHPEALGVDRQKSQG